MFKEIEDTAISQTFKSSSRFDHIFERPPGRKPAVGGPAGSAPEAAPGAHQIADARVDLRQLGALLLVTFDCKSPLGSAIWCAPGVASDTLPAGLPTDGFRPGERSKT